MLGATVGGSQPILLGRLTRTLDTMKKPRSMTILAALACALGAQACDRDKSNAAAGNEAADAKAAADAPPDAKADDAAGAAPAAQGEGGGATCATASKNLYALMKPELDKQLQELPEDQRATVEQQMNAEINVEAITAQCEQQQPTQKELDCVSNAKTMDELQACQPAPGGPPPGAMPPGGAPGGPPPGGEAPAPTPDAGDDS